MKYAPDIHLLVPDVEDGDPLVIGKLTGRLTRQLVQI